MTYRTWPGKPLLLLLVLLVAVLSCQKPDPEEEKPSELPPETAVFESMFTLPTVAYCGNTFTSDLKVRDGKNVGTVSVGNDDAYLYLSYNLDQNWYLVDVQCYAGTHDLIPKSGEGSPNHGRFPGKQSLSPCDMKQTFTFRVLLSSLNFESEADCAVRYFTAMRASVRHIANADACTTGEDDEAWAAPILINPGKKSEWATAFYYCKQECQPTSPPAQTWCAFGQGYWFASGKHTWCAPGQVSFGNLVVTEAEGLKLWGTTGKPSTMQKAFYQAAALQLSKVCLHAGQEMPADILDDYQVLEKALSAYTKAEELKSATLSLEEETAIQNALGNIGRWICANNCNAKEDPSACTK